MAKIHYNPQTSPGFGSLSSSSSLERTFIKRSRPQIPSKRINSLHIQQRSIYKLPLRTKHFKIPSPISSPKRARSDTDDLDRPSKRSKTPSPSSSPQHARSDADDQGRPSQGSKAPSPASSPKRARYDTDDQDRPSKQAKTSPEPESGPKKSDILKDISPKRASSTLTTADEAAYLRRLATSSQAYVNKKKRKLARKVNASWKHMPNQAQKGMKNLTGALCYRHSLFQALVHSPKVVNWLRIYHAPETCILETSAACVACTLRSVVLAYWSGIGAELTKSLQEINKVFKINNWTAGVASGQGDPEEHFTWLINKMSEQLPTQIYGIFEAFHNFTIDSSTSCTKCGHVSTNSGETEGIISLEILPKITNGTLSQYVHRYLTYSVQGYKCDNCKDATTKQRSRVISHSPDVAIFQLLRFDPLGRKVNHVVSLPALLDLNEYRTPDNKKNSVYELSAVIKHGGSAGSGHYICSAKGPDGNWQTFDDDSKSRTTPEAVAAGAKGRMTPYILFFQRQRKSE